MSTVAVSTCSCGTIGADPKVRLCVEHHRYWRGDKELVSVSKVIRETWPVKKNFEDADPWTLENARVRGVETDWLFSEWLVGRLQKIPAGTRTDAKDRFLALVQWWRERGFANAVPQVILADDEIAGMADVASIVAAPIIADLKNVSAIDPSYHLQLGGYADLYEAQFGVAPQRLGIIHVTQPKDKPVNVRFVEVGVSEARADWKALRAMWKVVQRRISK